MEIYRTKIEKLNCKTQAQERGYETKPDGKRRGKNTTTEKGQATQKVEVKSKASNKHNEVETKYVSRRPKGAKRRIQNRERQDPTGSQ